MDAVRRKLVVAGVELLAEYDFGLDALVGEDGAPNSLVSGNFAGNTQMERLAQPRIIREI